MVIDAFHLPGLPHVPTTTWSYGRGKGAFEIRVPRLTPALLRQQVRALGEARERALAGRPVAEIVAVIDRVAARLLDPADELRRTAEGALPAITHYSPAMVGRVLDRMAADWRAAPLRELLRSELGDPRVLDGFRPAPRGHGRRMAMGPRLAAHVFSGNVPGVAVTSIVRSLLVKAATLGKTAVGEPLLPALFARAVAEEDAELGACIAVTYWHGGDEELERAALEHADAVIVYGGRDAVTAIRAKAPAEARFLAYGPRLSFGIVARGRLTAEHAGDVARAAALDASTFDQQGCVSPHVFYAEEGGDVSPRAWAAMLAREMESVERDLPRGTLSPSEASAIRQLRGHAEFAAGLDLHASAEGTAWTVVYDPEPAFEASCLNRVVRVKPVAALEEIPPLVAAYAEVLQTVGVAASAEEAGDLAAALGRLGASRIAPLGKMAWPPPWWHHDGRPPLRSLVRWCDWEE
ncbi:acyl-CoA reductase [Longimicrobium sp.]|uniref:acyl-CoA reductase n=1 Tax=Longimicrobium sp. TaxID=2029185 RepID=UPI002D05F5A8|nr:acyl-CoA reductase [Longimicrobium sp.]HSU16191.1 acyl-CoA reductase [Longimicrobium sp.]